MPKITLAKTQKVIEVPVGSNLMQSLLDAEIPVASSCSGEGVCGKCRIKVTSNPQGLAPESQTEKEIKDIHDIGRGERVSCQAKVVGDVTIDAPYW